MVSIYITNKIAINESRFNEAIQPSHALANMTDSVLLEEVSIPKDKEDAAYKWLEKNNHQFIPGIFYYLLHYTFLHDN